jgi:hypothetical protein
MAEQTITETQFLREDPRFEDIKLDLLEQASRLTRGKDAAGQDLPYEQTLTGRLPSFQVAGVLSCPAGRTSGRHATGRWKLSALH